MSGILMAYIGWRLRERCAGSGSDEIILHIIGHSCALFGAPAFFQLYYPVFACYTGMLYLDLLIPSPYVVSLSFTCHLIW